MISYSAEYVLFSWFLLPNCAILLNSDSQFNVPGVLNRSPKDELGVGGVEELDVSLNH